MLIPEVVWKEAVSHYERQVQKRVLAVQTAIKEVNKLTTNNWEPSEFVDVDEETSLFEKRLNNPRGSIGAVSTLILQNPESSLAETVERLIKRIKPASADGKSGFRDVLIWLSIKNYLATSRNKRASFISANWNDFGIKEGNKVYLDPQLKQEIEGNSWQLHYYDSIEAFLEARTEVIKGYSRQWLESQVSPETVSIVATPRIDEEAVRLHVYAKQNLEDTTGFLVFRGFTSNPTLNDFKVYKVSEDERFLQITYEAEVYMEVEIEHPNYVFQIGEEYSDDKRHYYQAVYPKVTLSFSAKIVDDDVEQLHLENWDFIKLNNVY